MAQKLEPANRQEEQKIESALQFIKDNSQPIETQIARQSYEKGARCVGFYGNAFERLQRDKNGRPFAQSTHADIKFKQTF